MHTFALMSNFLFSHLAHKNLVQLVGLVFQGSAMKYILTELMGTVRDIQYVYDGI